MTASVHAIPAGPSGHQPNLLKTRSTSRDGKQSLRDMLFVSHANPENNEFAQWLSLQLAKCGYPVWCDLTKLLGGETFWTDIEQALRTRTVKFLYVLSKISNSKDGPLSELQIAANVKRDENLHDFIIPLLIDDLPHREINIQIARLTVVNFRKSWSQGLKDLLEKLESECVEQRKDFSPTAVAAWWRSQHGAAQGVTNQPEEHLSNWFPIRELPETIFMHRVSGWPNNEEEGVPLSVRYPAIRHDRYIVTFAPARIFESGHEIETSYQYETEQLLADALSRALLDRTQARNLTSYLLKDAWEHAMRARQLPEYELSNRTRCFWFQKNSVSDDTIHFESPNGRKSTRQVVGFKSLTANKDGITPIRYWHFGFQAKATLYPFVGFCVKPHVLFTDDGYTVWDSKERLHKARRNQCSMWWNPKWRDLLLATMSHLAGGAKTVSIDIAPTRSVEVEISPVRFVAPVSFEDHPLPDETDVVTTDDTEDEFEESGEAEL
jgi:hypothetical protein